MSRAIPEDEPLSPEDRRYLEDRGNYALIRRIDEATGGAPEPDADSEESLAQQIQELESQLTDLRARQSQLQLQREQEEARVKDNTVVDGEGGSEALTDNYDAQTKAQLAAEIERRNEDRDDDDQISSSGTKAQLIERLRAMDAEEDDDEDDEDAE